MTNSSISQLKVKNCAHSRIFKDRNPNARTFQFLDHSRIFKDRGNPIKSTYYETAKTVLGNHGNKEKKSQN